MLVWKAILILTGILAALVLLCMGVIRVERRFPSEKYDERQKIARGNAYRISFWVGMVYYLIVLVVMIRQVDHPKTVEPYLLVFAGLMLQIMVMHIYCILTQAALPLSEKPGIAAGSYLACGIFYILMNDFTKPLSLVGYESRTCTGLMLCVSFFALGIMHIISLLSLSHREKE